MVHYKLQEYNVTDHYNHKFVTDNKIRELETDLRRSREDKQKYEVDFKIISEKHLELQEKFKEIEKENDFIKNKQSDELLIFETKLDKMSKELESLQKENSTLRSNESRLRNEVKNLEMQRDNFRDDFQETKNHNQNLNSDISKVNFNANIS
jgi:chromosome segregation ATPase